MPEPVEEISSRRTWGVETSAPDLQIDDAGRDAVNRLVREAITAAVSSTAKEASKLLAPQRGDRDGRPGRMALVVSVLTLGLLLSAVIVHESGSSKFERAIEGLIDVLSEQNPERAADFREVERQMHR